MNKLSKLSKKYNFADTITSNFVGEEALGYVSASILSGTTLAENNITLLPNVNYKANVRKIAVPTSGNALVDASCDFTDSIDMSYTEAILEPKPLEVNMQICKKDFIDTWEGSNQLAGLNGALPVSFVDYIMGITAEQVAGEIESNIWVGGVGTGQFSGFKLNLIADGDVSDISGTTLAAGNIVGEMEKVLNAIPSRVYGKEDLKLFVPTSAWKFYIQSQATLGFNTQYNMNGQFEFMFNGVRVAHAPGLTDNTMVCARTSNLFFGTGGDYNQVRVLDMTENDLSDNVRVAMRFSAGVQHAFGSDIVLYDPTV